MNKKQYPVRDALAAAGLLIANLSHCCHQIAVAGSLQSYQRLGEGTLPDLPQILGYIRHGTIEGVAAEGRTARLV